MSASMPSSFRWVLLGAVLLATAIPAAGQNGVTAIDSLNLRHGGPGPSYGFYYASCWGYVAPDGHEYALIGCYSGTSIIDLDATPIREVAYIPGSNSEWKEIKTWGQYAYAVSENSAMGLQIIDLRFLPDSARIARTLFTIGPKNVGRSHTVTVADGYLYLNGGSSNGTTMYSLADPTNPVYVGEYQPAYLHDTYVRNDTLYGAAINGQGLYIASVANKAAPVQLGLITYSGSGTHNAWASVDGRYVFTTDEVGSTQKNMKVWDISALPSITPLTPYTFNPSTVIHNVHGRGNYIYVAHYKSGVYVADVHNPTAISTGGTFNTYRGGGSSASYAGCWGVYPYFPSGRWIASDTQTGLYVLRFTGLATRTRSPLLLPANNSSVAPGPIAFRWRSAANQTEDPHYYQLHVYGPGVDTLLKTRDTSVTVTSFPGIQNGQTYSWHLWIKDEFTAVTSQDTFRFTYAPEPTHLDTLRHINLKPNGGYSAIWGYTAPNGREYAIIGLNGNSGQTPGTSFVDITDNSNMRQVGFVPGPISSWREMKTYKQYAYIVTEASGSGTQIVDLSYLPDSVHLVRTFVYTQGSNNTSKSHTITMADGFMYLNGCANWSPGGIVIFDLRADPTNPQFVGTYEPEYIHDSYVLRDTIYASAVYSGGGLHIANATNKSSVQEIGKITYTGSGTHNAWVTKDRRYALTTDEIGTITPKQLHVWDISNLPSIPTTAAAAFTLSPSDIVHNVTIRGDYAYVAWYTRGAVVVDIANPLAPSLAGDYDTSTQPPGNYAGVWGIYPYFPSGKIVASDMQNGLWVFSFSDLAPRVPVNLILPVNNVHVSGPSPIAFRWTSAANMNKDPHYYEVHLTGPGLDTTWRAADTVTTFGALARLQTGQTYSWNVATRDEWNNIPSPFTYQFVFDGATGVQEGELPYAFALEQNYPNPFNPSTTINYEIAAQSHVLFEVFNLLGERVAELVRTSLPAGKYQAVFDGTRLPSGVYIYRATYSPEEGDKITRVETRKMVLIK